MFFEPRVWKKTEEKIHLPATVTVGGFEGYAETVLSEWISRFANGEGTFSVTATQDTDIPTEGYVIVLRKDAAEVRYADLRGMIYAAVTLLQLSECDELTVGEISDHPDCEFRGYRVYLPGRKSLAEFKEMVDFLVYYKYNTISLEVGGAMEYKRHPEINEKWAEFAADTHRYSGRAHEIQNGYPWAKNSIHTDNAEGDILTQDEVREVIAYCRSRGLDVYPEAPTLSHTDYICLAHPEIAERAEDPYPDTCCPSNPRSYELMFDVLEEVIEVFEPEIVNIGHDELYSVCLCEKCRDKKPYELFAEDVTRIHDFLAERGIRTAMWADKLLPVVSNDGYTYGGAGKDRVEGRGRIFFPPTFQCQSMLPRDVLMIHWYYSFGFEYDAMIHRHGYPMIYGNMSVARVENWRMRREWGAKGGSCSNWGSNHPIYMQRNAQYINLVMGAYALWSPTYDTSDLPVLTQASFAECYRKHYGDLNGYIEVTHTTQKSIPYKVFYDGVFIEDEIYRMGKYVLTYTDGTVAEFPVVYGTNIASDKLGQTEEGEVDPTLGVAEAALYEVSYSTVPMGDGKRTVYRTAFKNPHPEKQVGSFVYHAENGDVDLLSVRFCG